MTRKDIESLYTVKNGIIHAPGKFEGCAAYVPYFWDYYHERVLGVDREDENGFVREV